MTTSKHEDFFGKYPYGGVKKRKSENRTEPQKTINHMGNSESSSSDPRFASASRAFAQNELEDLRSLFTSLAAQSQTDGKHVSLPVFKVDLFPYDAAYIGIGGPLGDRLFYLMMQKHKDQMLSFEDLVIAKGTYEKGTTNDIEEFIYQLLDINNDGIVGRSDLEAVLTEMLGTLFHQGYSKSVGGSLNEIVDIFVSAATFTSDDAESMSFEDFQKWCSLLPSVRKFLGGLMMPSDPGSQIPQLLHQDNIDPSLILLRKEYAWHIGGALPQHELDEWKLLYHSSIHGQSFNTFLGNIQNNEGPTVLVIKDKEGYIYGGYASQPWERHADFYGDMKSFLFQLSPKASIFRPTAANHNLQWFAVNFSSESFPNGIGFGGRVNHFGLFISANFDQGHTLACTTFGSPCLSKTHQIYPEVIECWGVVPHEKDRPEGLKGTVLERFKEDRHMLNMVGLANSSE